MTDAPKTSKTDNQRSVTSEPRLSRAAVEYADALLSVQRDRFERELAVAQSAGTTSFPSLPTSVQLFPESDQFIGAGWSKLGTNRKGMSFRWMARIGSLLLSVDLSSERTLVIKGCGYTKRRFLKECTLWIEDTQVSFSLSRQGFNRWTIEATMPTMPARPYYLLRLQSPGVSRLAEGIDAHASLAISEVRIGC